MHEPRPTDARHRSEASSRATSLMGPSRSGPDPLKRPRAYRDTHQRSAI